MCERLDVVDERRAAEVPDLRRERRAQARHRAPTLHRLEHRGLLARDVGARADHELQRATLEEAGGAQLLDRAREPLSCSRVLLAQVDPAVLRLREPHRDDDALEEEVRPQLHDVPVLDRPRLALVGVDDDVPRAWLVAHRLPLDPRREAGASEARDP